MNRELAAHILDELFRAGVREMCLCAGARSAPLVSLLSQDTRFRTLYFFEERCAAFFGLGRIKESGRPVGIVTTSGTAAGELLPATMEAYYSGLPLVLVTADRPRRFRGSGAPQTAEQVGLYGVYAEGTVDLAEAERFEIARWSRQRPLHLNVCFDEPLLEAAPDSPVVAPVSDVPQAADSTPSLSAEANRQFAAFREASRSPVVIVGGLTPEERPAALAFLAALGASVILESQSGLREHPALQALSLRTEKKALMQKTASGGDSVWMDGVLRLGSVPTLRLWRDLEVSLQHLPLLSLSSQPFAGTSGGTLVHGSLSGLLNSLSDSLTGAAPVPPERVSRLMARDRALSDALVRLLAREPRSEPGLIHCLSRHLPAGARLFLGNSLPIREWDLAATFEPRGLEIGASRGLNGIDGQLSTALGFSRAGGENWGLFGDLTTLYDMAAPWILRQLPDVVFHAVVINNGGGKIFQRMFPDPAFQNKHDLSFESLAQFWGLDYKHWETVPESPPPLSPSRGSSLIEIVPDGDATARFWQAYDMLLTGE